MLAFMNIDQFKHKLSHNFNRALTTGRWIVFSLLCGGIMGAVGTLFYHSIAFVTTLRENNPLFLLLLPFGAAGILLFYHFFHYDNDGGTNLVLSAIQSDDHIPGRMSVLIFFATILSHLAGASVGREGAALQIGGSLGGYLGKLLHLDEREKKTMIMCGMSAVFAALFGTPMAAAIFSMEVVSVGIMHYAALVPCVLASYVAVGVAGFFGAHAGTYTIEVIPAFDFLGGFYTCLFALAFGLVSMFFCICLHRFEQGARFLFKNAYLRAIVLGTVLLVCTALSGDQMFNGSGVRTIAACMRGEHYRFAFLLKIFFTSISIAAGYKGGEIIPSLFIGASFGSLIASLIGLDPSLAAAVGMGSVFCGVTNCPITSLLLCFELFGMEAAPYFLISIALSYVVSGYYSLYRSQKIVYSKFKSNFIDKKAD